MNAEDSFAAWMGLDWGDQCHWVCLRCAGSQGEELFALEQQPAAIHQWVAQLRLRFGGRPVAIALEQSRGALLTDTTVTLAACQAADVGCSEVCRRLTVNADRVAGEIT